MAVKYSSNYDGTRPFTDISLLIFLSDSTQLLSIPGVSNTDNFTYQADFSYASNSNIFVGLNKAPVIPDAGNPNIVTSYVDFKPEKRYVKAGDVLHFSSKDTGVYVGVSISQLD